MARCGCNGNDGIGAIALTDGDGTFVLGDGSRANPYKIGVGGLPHIVTSVAGRTGSVILDKTDVGLANVANTADLAKPISTATATALAGKAPVVDLVSRLVAPIFIAHRGGANLYPEHSMAAYRATTRDGFLPEQDLRALSDGTLVSLHDATCDRTMTITGDPATKTIAQWRASKLKPIVTGGKYEQPPTWEEILNEFGGKVVVVPEIKLDDTALTSAIISSITSRGLQKAAIIQSFYLNRCTTAAAAGCQAMFLTSNTATTPAAIVAAGCQWVGISSSVSNTYISSCIAAGLKTVVWIVDEKATIDTYLALGAVGVFSNDPWRGSRRFAPAVSTDFASGFLWPNASMVQASPELVTLTPVDSCLRFSYSGTTAGLNARVRMGQFGELPMNGVYRFGLQFKAGALDQTRWLGMWIGHLADDAPFLDGDDTSSNPAGYHFLVRRNGAKDIYVRNAVATSTQIATHTSASPYAASTTVDGAVLEFEVTITSTDLTIKCLTDGDVTTVSNSAVRPSDAAISFTALSGSVDLLYLRVGR